ncbi:uncharacterized protein LOC108668687, partial [Hyalella azteca]|uniref:Uncharacterized protein LOC108668687 n=1 Tax=Hyalella azteca TaxID=294128 RepID=A0A8B7NCV3_HYAAZ
MVLAWWLVALLSPSLASAKLFIVGGCPGGAGFADPLTQTAYGRSLVNKWTNLPLIAWHPTGAEAGLRCITLTAAGDTLYINFKYSNMTSGQYSGPIFYDVYDGNNRLRVDTTRGSRMPNT